MSHSAIRQLSSDDWFEICKYLSPCDLFRLSQIDQLFYNNYCSLSSDSKQFGWLSSLIQQQIVDHLNNSKLIEPLLFDDELKLVKSMRDQQSKLQSRKHWKDCLKIYLKLSYLPILDRKNSQDCEFLIHVPSFRLKKFMERNKITEIEQNLVNSDRNIVVLLHGKRECDKITLFSIEHYSTNRPIEQGVHLSRVSLIDFSKIAISNHSAHEQMKDIVSNIYAHEQIFENVDIYHHITNQEFVYPNRTLCFSVEALARYKSSLYFRAMDSYTAQINMRMHPFETIPTFSRKVLIRAFGYIARDSLLLALLGWYGYVKSRSEKYFWFRQGIAFFKLPFNHPTMVGEPSWKVNSYLGAFILYYLVYGVIGIYFFSPFSAAIPIFHAVEYIRGTDYFRPPEDRPLRSIYNLLVNFETSHLFHYVLACGFCGRVIYHKLQFWLRSTKYSLTKYFKNWWFSKSKPIPHH